MKVALLLETLLAASEIWELQRKPKREQHRWEIAHAILALQWVWVGALVRLSLEVEALGLRRFREFLALAKLVR